MVVMAENAQDQGLRARVDVMAAGDAKAAEPVGSRRRKMVQTEIRGEHVASKELGGEGTAVMKKMAARRPEARTEFLGVSRAVNGKYSAQIRASKGTMRWLGGTFDTAEDAARAYDAAAVELHGASAVTNFKPSGDSSGSQSAGSDKMKVKKRAAARPDARTAFRGVWRTTYGKYAANIWDSKLKSARSLGTFGTAVEAARAFDAAAVELRGASAVTNFKASGELSGQAEGSLKMKPAAAKPDARTEFRGVQRLQSGMYRARISKGKSLVSLGRFGTAEEAARAFDAAAVELRGAAARTNFEQQPMFDQKHTAGVADDGEVSSMHLPNDFPELTAVVFSESLIPGPLMDDLGTDWPTAADLQLVHDFLKGFDQVVA